MSRPGLSSEAVIQAALQVIDDRGAGGLTLAAVASRLSVATPSLYNHVRGLIVLRNIVSLRVLEDLADAIGAAVMGKSRDEAIGALLGTYRHYVTTYPNRYASLPQQYNQLATAALSEAAARITRVTSAVLKGYGLSGEDLVHASRLVGTTAHGFASLETAPGFTSSADPDVTFAYLTEMLTARLRTWNRRC